MHSILHKITIETEPEKLYQALTTQAGLSAWWTKATTSCEPGSIASFFFGPEGDHRVDMEICELEPNSTVTWNCVDGPWVQTGQFRLAISPDVRGTVLHFSHDGWKDTDDFYQHCNAKWGYFLAVSLKSYLESGTGQPHPADPDI